MSADVIYKSHKRLALKLFVTVKPSAKQNKVEALSATQFKISVTAEPRDGKANEAAIRELADFFNIASSRLTIISGHTSKKKVILYERLRL